MKDWSEIKHFKPGEFEHPDKIQPEIIGLLDWLRELFVEYPFIIHPGGDYRKPRNPDPLTWKSQHNFGRAIDFHIKGLYYKDAVDTMEWFLNQIGMSGRVGLGIYPHWNNPGFHLDTRGHMTRWGAVNRNGKQVYVIYNKAYQLIGE